MNVRRIPTLALLAVAAFTLACQKSNAQAQAVPDPAAMTDEQKTMYALGMMMGRNLAAFSLTPAEVELVKKGLQDSAAGVKSDIDPQTMMPKIQALAQSRQAARSEVEKARARSSPRRRARRQAPR
jgi:FKBP-type peptidyl-prolyl cis-trans isomerase FkpA